VKKATSQTKNKKQHDLTPETLPTRTQRAPGSSRRCRQRSRVGLEGRVVIETTKTLDEVRADGESRRDGAEFGSTFEFAITDEPPTISRRDRGPNQTGRP